MRKNHHEQPTLMAPWLSHEHCKELEALSAVLDTNPMVAALAAQDLVAVEVSVDLGREGMSGDMAVRALIVRQLNGYSYEELGFHLVDSATYRRFCGLGPFDLAPKRSALAANIKRLRPETLESINKVVLGEAEARGVEDGQKARVDCTVVASNIHEPDDAALLFDVVRVLVRNLARARELCGATFSSRHRRAKRRMFDVRCAKKSEARVNAYRDLIDVTLETLDFVPAAVAKLAGCTGDNERAAQKVRDELMHFAALGWQVADQTWRRVFEGEKVPAAEKIVSIFEEHTDIIVKDRRDVHYGHKVCLSTGPSSLVLDCLVLDGNPADSTLVGTMLDRHNDIYDRMPRQVAMDGGFASKANVALAKDKGVEDIAFSKRRGIAITDMVKSTWVYKRLKRFRAGVEGGISFLKRCFGMDRCRWRGSESFQSYVWAAVLTCNLLVLARHALA